MVAPLFRIHIIIGDYTYIPDKFTVNHYAHRGESFVSMPLAHH